MSKEAEIKKLREELESLRRLYENAIKVLVKLAKEKKKK
jgi:hypothetical protein